ncbi:MAG TPA: hypothetical protein VHZ51_26770 [Ktedonobacteraceae bacterium]|nr:hypothetical protein [Ktedonobacteraceae bacterium]
MIIWLLLIFAACTVVSVLLCGLARVLFPKFRSGEHKPGTHRTDLPAGGRDIRTFELPLVGGPAMMLAIIGVGLAAGYLLNLDQEQWTFLLIGLGAAFGFGLVGFLDDWNKVHSNEGLSEIAKFGGVFSVSVVVAALYFFLLPLSGQEPYQFWTDLPIFTTLFNNHAFLTAVHHGHDIVYLVSLTRGPISYFVWLIFILLMTGVFGSLTSLSVDFSDGLDGLAGGLVFSAALAFGVVVAGLLNKPEGIVLEVLALLIAAGTLGYLPWNWPSAWAARKSLAPRRAKIIMGDCGSLGLGGMIAIIAILSRNETLLLIIGGAFVLEGLSALMTRLLTRFYRKSLKTLRFTTSDKFVPHTEFPLPFLAAPLHHHFDLLGWDRRRLVYSAWALGACFAFLGASVSLVEWSWERYIIRGLALILAVIIWSSGSWSKCYFVGKHPAGSKRKRRLALYYGYPYEIMGVKLYHLVEIIEASEDVIETPAEEAALWQRMSIFDARAMLGLYCYRANYEPAALAQWTRIPERNRVLRPEIVHLLAEVDNRLAIEKQETQPMKRDEIMHQQAIFNGKVPLADLPNPYEPVSHLEIGNEEESEEEDWIENGNEKERIATSILSNNEATNGAHNGHHNHSSMNEEQPAEMLSSFSANGKASTSSSNWISRLLRSSSK